MVIDWENVGSGSPAADVARSIYLIRDAAMAGVPAPLAIAIGAIRAIVARAYLAGYRSVQALDTAEIDAWRLPILATRLAEGIDEERAMLTREIDASLGKS
jgi:aminoglycoside phosphotransferase (APT) family kinase protein